LTSQVSTSFWLISDFINPAEEESLLKEIEPHLQRQVYEKDHWDEVIYCVVQGGGGVALTSRLNCVVQRRRGSKIFVVMFRPRFIRS
jgi:hypothetical protein